MMFASPGSSIALRTQDQSRHLRKILREESFWLSGERIKPRGSSFLEYEYYTNDDDGNPSKQVDKSLYQEFSLRFDQGYNWLSINVHHKNCITVSACHPHNEPVSVVIGKRAALSESEEQTTSICIRYRPLGLRTRKPTPSRNNRPSHRPAALDETAASRRPNCRSVARRFARSLLPLSAWAPPGPHLPPLAGWRCRAERLPGLTGSGPVPGP